MIVPMKLSKRQRRLDEKFMRRCIELASKAVRMGDLPVGAVIVHNGKIIAEGYNHIVQDFDAHAHAQGIAMRKAQKRLRKSTLEDCTLYTTLEPCCMCSQPARELKIPRVVWALNSLEMGGYSRYKILRDIRIAKKVPSHFGPPPIVVTGVLRDEYIQRWKRWAPESIDELLKEKIFA